MPDPIMGHAGEWDCRAWSDLFSGPAANLLLPCLKERRFIGRRKIVWKREMMTHIRHLMGLGLGLALVGCSMEDRGQSESKHTSVEPGQVTTLVEGTADEGTLDEGTFDETDEPIGPSTIATHHHHKRGHNCGHGLWATSDDAGHHHHKRGANCEAHNVWATSTNQGHHHHKRGDNCVHNKWATSDQFSDEWLNVEDQTITEEAFSDDPSVPYDLSDSDQRSYSEVEAELTHLEQTE
jgi:hypothetical protein